MRVEEVYVFVATLTTLCYRLDGVVHLVSFIVIIFSYSIGLSFFSGGL